MDPTQARRHPSGSSTRQRTTLLPVPTTGTTDASQYFSIETRLELKKRLTKLQLQLRQLLVQAKLAWMRCFAEPRTTSSRAALQMVQLGEELTASLSRAFDLAAGTATAPLAEYQALVTRVEVEMATFQDLVDCIALGNYPDEEEEHPDEEENSCSSEEESGVDHAQEEPTYLDRPVHIDLPSMQTYCKHVAPPYSSYLPRNVKSPTKRTI